MNQKVLLCSMPFGALERQALGLSLLKARLSQMGIPCDIHYLTFSFADLIGVTDYNWIVSEAPYTAFAGDWSFTSALYGENREADAAYIREVLQGAWRFDGPAIDRLLRVRSLVPHFLDHCLAALPWPEYAMVGFTSTFEQNIASLALAKRVKETWPQLGIVFGGGNWEDEMGVELHRQFPFIDFVCPGEADQSFPALVEAVFAGRQGETPLASIPGLVYRSNGNSRFTGRSELVRDLDSLPIPDYTDYFHCLDQSSAASSVVPSLLFEGSRGCWWGARKQCAFCGLNGNTIAYRTKSAPRAIREIEHQVDAWRTDMIQAVDNILDMKSFRDFIPALIRQDRHLSFFYEIKASLSHDQVRMLAAAGVHWVQPGIESLNNHVLGIMRKGTSALQNVQLLKWCLEQGVSAQWNILHGFPGETRADYEDMLALLKQIRYLGAPTACGPIRLDRFSPYFRQPDKLGIRKLKPIAPYKYLYPFEDDVLNRIAYYFDYDYDPALAHTDHSEEVVAFVNEWQRNPETGSLRAFQRPDGSLALVDSRSDACRRSAILRGIDREVYEFCDQVRSPRSVHQHLATTMPQKQLTRSQVTAFLDSLVDNKLMVSDGSRYLSLALQADTKNLGMCT